MFGFFPYGRIRALFLLLSCSALFFSMSYSGFLFLYVMFVLDPNISSVIPVLGTGMTEEKKRTRE